MAKTGRLEEQRSSYSIIRSFNVHCIGINDKTKVADRIDLLLANGDLHLQRKDALIDEIGEDECYEAVEEVKNLLGYKGHFKRERVQGQIDAVTETAEQNKTTDARQSAAGVDLTMVALELTEHRKLKKDDHTKDLTVELKHRGKGDSDLVCPPDHEKKANKPLNFTDLKKPLIAVEMERVQSAGGDSKAVEQAGKAFMPLSGAEFKMTTK